MLQLKYVRTDSWDRPVYEDEKGRLWKDVNLGNGTPSLHRAVDDDIDGEPDYPISEEYVIVKEQKENPYKSEYMMLDMLRTRCEYYFGHGNMSPQIDIAYIISEMKGLWKSLPDNAKPEWLTWNQINEWESIVTGQSKTFIHYKERILEQARNTKPGEKFFDGTVPPSTGWTRYCVIEHVCSFPKLDPVQMAVALIKEGIKVYFDNSAISEKENQKLERAVMRALKGSA